MSIRRASRRSRARSRSPRACATTSTATATVKRTKPSSIAVNRATTAPSASASISAKSSAIRWTRPRRTATPPCCPIRPMASAELCNGLDDNCDGQIDEDTDQMVHIARNTLDFYIDKYEASRPDATASAVGTDETHLCGVANRLPWTNASFDEAKGACEASGKRLCHITELEEACEGANDRTYPYAGAYVGTTCNGIDAPGSAAAPTGSFASCISSDGVYDLSGNVAEWSDKVTGATTGMPGLRHHGLARRLVPDAVQRARVQVQTWTSSAPTRCSRAWASAAAKTGREAPLLRFEAVKKGFGGAKLAGLALHAGHEQRLVGGPEQASLFAAVGALGRVVDARCGLACRPCRPSSSCRCSGRTGSCRS